MLNNCGVWKTYRKLEKAINKESYPETMVKEEIQKATKQDRIGLLNKEKAGTRNHLILCVTYNKTLLNIKTILEKHWHILNVNPELKKVFEKRPQVSLPRKKPEIVDWREHNRKK